MNKEQIEKLRMICKNISVLYVEDDQNIATQVEKILKKIFIHVDLENNGLLGLKNYMKNHQDIVITDISMPVIDGIEMSKNIKNINAEQSILVTSAHNDTEYLIELIELGVDKFFNKPIDMGKFLSTISKIAVGIYREKMEAILEEKLSQQQNLQAKILDTVVVPLAYFEEDLIVYANNAFKEHFFTKKDMEDKYTFRLGYLFEEKKYTSISNSMLLNTIENTQTKIFTLMDVRKKFVKKYHIEIANIIDKKQRLVSFVNLDDINVELGRFKMQIDYFPKRDAFVNAVIEQKNNSQHSYYLFCIGLKNISRFIIKYGGVKMHTIYHDFARSIKKEFIDAVEKKMLSIYLFETNRYVFLADSCIVEDIEKKLQVFGTKYHFEYGSRLSFNLNIVKEEMAHNRSATDVFKNAEGMLYTFDD